MRRSTPAPRHSAPAQRATGRGSPRTKAQPTGPDGKTAGSLGVERLVFFSDAVFAIAITLLVMEIRLPELPGIASSRELLSALWSLVPRYVSFAVSFVVVGRFWMSHHSVFRLVRAYDGTLVLLSMLFLLFIAFLPFPTSVVGRFSAIPAGEAFYAAWVALAGFAKPALWVHAARGRRLLTAEARPRKVSLATVYMVVPGVVFLASIPLAWVHPMAPVAAWGVAPFARVAALLVRRHGLR